jgi:Zn finger protein HypA/HybF involved in hydrogenase expression
MSTTDSDIQIDLGGAVYDEDGTKLGTIRGLDRHGFYVSAESNADVLSNERAPGRTDETALMWRCWECGEMGRLTDMPESCPACGAPKENIYCW